MKKVLVLGASRYQSRTIETLKGYGYRVAAIDKNPSAEGFRCADESAAIDITDEEGARTFAEQRGVDGVLAVSDFGVRTAAYVSEKLGLPGLARETAALLTDKALMRERWSRDGVPVPRFFVAESLEEAYDRLHSLRFPVIVKPADSRGGGSRGVKVVFAAGELQDAFKSAQSFYSDKRVVIEECVTGTEHSVEAVVTNGIVHIVAISEKEKTPYPYRVDKRVIYPAALSDKDSRDLRDTVQAAVGSVGIQDGVAHVELALTSDGPVLFEIGGRCGGGATPQIVESYTGVEYLRAAVRLVVGEPIRQADLEPRFEKGAVYHFFIFPPGRVKEIRRSPELARRREIEDLEIFVGPGDDLREVATGPGRHGFAVIVADTRASALEVSLELDSEVTPVYCEAA